MTVTQAYEHCSEDTTSDDIDRKLDDPEEGIELHNSTHTQETTHFSSQS